MHVQAQVFGAATLDLVEDAHGHLLQHLSLVLDFICHFVLLGLVCLVAAIVAFITVLAFLLLLPDFDGSVAASSLCLTLRGDESA